MRRLAVVLVSLALTAAACGGGDDGDESAADKTTTSTTAVDSATATTTTVDPAAPNATGTGEGATAPASVGTGGSAGSGGSGSGGTGTTTKSRQGANTTSATVKHAAPGNYTYNRTGHASTSAFGDRSLDGPVQLQVDPPTQNDQRSVRSGPEGTSEQIVRIVPEGGYFTYLKQSNSGLSKEFRPNPIVLAAPSDAAPGRAWSWTVTSTDGATTLNASFKIERTETVTIGDQATKTHVFAIVLKISGDLDATTHQTSWVSLDKGLIVKSDERTDGSFGNVTFNSQSSMTLTSTKPA